MNSLDERARHAVEGLRQAVSQAELSLPVPGAPSSVGTPMRSRVLSFAGAFAVLILLVGLFVARTDQSPVANDIQEGESPVTAPILEGPVIIPEVSAPDQDEGPVEEPIGEPNPTSSTVAAEQPAEELDTTPPHFAITSPLDGATFEEKNVRFEGTVEPGADVFAGKYQADVDEEGHWSIVLVLSRGGNRATLTATDAAGNTASDAVTVYYDPPVEATTTTVAEVSFTANQRFGSCSFTPPYDEFFGTAPPEHKIKITSEYGSGTVYADAEGNWDVRVYFETAPADTPFLVTVTHWETGETFKFEFVYTP